MPEDRRGVLKLLTGVVGAGAAAAVGVPSLVAFVGPARMRTVVGADGFLRVCALEALPADGTPIKLGVLVPAPRDAWVTLPPSEVGAVYLSRIADGVRALSTICPHLGCGIEHTNGGYACPCHDSAFGEDGAIRAGPSPRPLDALETRIVDGFVEVRYAQFKTGTSEQVPL